jgi:hypothetical protein
MNNKNISIITNFGCRSNCWYCIWKGHELQYCNQPTDWDRLERFLACHSHKGKFSVSGGGDCLYNYDDHYEWWDKIFYLANKHNMLVDVHTREKFHDSSFFRKINRCVFSSDILSDCKEYIKWLSNYTEVRITHLVTGQTTLDVIRDYINFTSAYNIQFTIKQLIGHNDYGRFDTIRKQFPNVYYLEEGDYNIYYMPDNSIRKSFL